MSAERKVDIFAGLILVVSLVGIILLAFLPFAGFYLPSYGNRYSCFDCEYSGPLDLTAQIFILILLIVQIVIALNDLLPKRFISQDLSKIGMILAALTFIWVLIGLAGFGATYAEYDWWLETGFYATLIAGLLNTVLFFLKYKNK
ncbi:MAG: hypothetical protein ACFFEY_08350 [Candidatus Thorarchaeota archaeon]